MKPSELRIGNWVDTIEGPARITAIGSDGLITTSILPGGDHSAFIQPTPLTYSMLLAAGFTKVGAGEFTNGSFEPEVHFVRGISSGVRGDLDDNINPLVYIRIPRAVHQLQNLYFALTGQELEINL